MTIRPIEVVKGRNKFISQGLSDKPWEEDASDHYTPI